MYRAVVLDIDGTLVDSNDGHAEAWMRALEEYGIEVPFVRVRPLIGMGSDKLLPELTSIAADSQQGREIVDRRREIFQREYIPHLHATRGAQELLEWMRDDNLKLVVATSADPDEVHDLLRIAGATKLVDAASSSGDAKRSKPDPDILHVAVAKSGCPLEEIVMIGDTPYDIEAARRSGIGIIALRCGGWWTDDKLAGALAIYDDPQDLLEHYDVSPFKHPLTAGIRD